MILVDGICESPFPSRRRGGDEHLVRPGAPTLGVLGGPLRAAESISGFPVGHPLIRMQTADPAGPIARVLIRPWRRAGAAGKWAPARGHCPGRLRPCAPVTLRAPMYMPAGRGRRTKSQPPGREQDCGGGRRASPADGREERSGPCRGEAGLAASARRHRLPPTSRTVGDQSNRVALTLSRDI